MLQGYRSLTPRIALRPGEAKRHIWAAPEVHDLLKGLKPNAGFPDKEADLFVGRYCKGYILHASRRFKSKAEFKWLNGPEQVWVLSFRKPPPGWRILGRFARKNTFVAMAVYEREELGDLITYNEKAQAVIGLWNQQFPGITPHGGKEFADFLGMHKDDDEQH